jgi:hypothetical protein
MLLRSIKINGLLNTVNLDKSHTSIVEPNWYSLTSTWDVIVEPNFHTNEITMALERIKR